jgi:hypothetical protein
MENEGLKRSPAPGFPDGLMEGIGKMVGAFVRQEIAKAKSELRQEALKMGGVWHEGERYLENTLVTHHGGLWLACCDTDTRPGSGSPAWRLAVKSGSAK